MPVKVGLQVVSVLWAAVVIVGIFVRQLVAGLATEHGQSTSTWWLGVLSEAFLVIPLAGGIIISLVFMRIRSAGKQAPSAPQDIR